VAAGAGKPSASTAHASPAMPTVTRLIAVILSLRIFEGDHIYRSAPMGDRSADHIPAICGRCHIDLCPNDIYSTEEMSYATTSIQRAGFSTVRTHPA
jgi:hypothetical protein